MPSPSASPSSYRRSRSQSVRSRTRLRRCHAALVDAVVVRVVVVRHPAISNSSHTPSPSASSKIPACRRTPSSRCHSVVELEARAIVVGGCRVVRVASHPAISNSSHTPSPSASAVAVAVVAVGIGARRRLRPRRSYRRFKRRTRHHHPHRSFHRTSIKFVIGCICVVVTRCSLRHPLLQTRRTRRRRLHR